MSINLFLKSLASKQKILDEAAWQTADVSVAHIEPSAKVQARWEKAERLAAGFAKSASKSVNKTLLGLDDAIRDIKDFIDSTPLLTDQASGKELLKILVDMRKKLDVEARIIPGYNNKYRK